MRGIRGSKEAMGFVILTILLSLVFVVSIAFATLKYEYGSADGVYWNVVVGDLSYNPVTKTTSSYHYYYVYNGREEKIYYTAEFDSWIGGQPGFQARESHTWVELEPGAPASYGNTLVIDVNGLTPGWKYWLNAYTRIKLYDKDGDPISISPPKDGQIEDQLEFTR